jgi:uncharacterized protein
VDASIDFVERMYAVMTDDDVEPFLRMCAADASVHYPAEGLLPYGGMWRGRDAIRSFLVAHDAAEEILAFEPSSMAASDDRVFVIGRFEGRAKPTGRIWGTEFVHVMTVGDNQLLRWQAFFDTAAAASAHR